MSKQQSRSREVPIINEDYYKLVHAAWACEQCAGMGHFWNEVKVCRVCRECSSLRKAMAQIQHSMMSLESKPGDKVRYHWGLAGFDGDVKIAREKLTLGNVYTVKRLDVYDSSSAVYFEEIEGAFNPVQFAPVAGSGESLQLEILRALTENDRRWVSPEAVGAVLYTLERLSAAKALPATWPDPPPDGSWFDLVDACASRDKTPPPISQHFNGLTPAEDESLTLIAEECAEVIQAITKIQRHGLHSVHPQSGVPNWRTLSREVGDLEASLRVGEIQHLFDWSEVVAASNSKLRLLPKYLHHAKVIADK